MLSSHGRIAKQCALKQFISQDGRLKPNLTEIQSPRAAIFFHALKMTKMRKSFYEKKKQEKKKIKCKSKGKI